MYLCIPAVTYVMVVSMAPGCSVSEGDEQMDRRGLYLEDKSCLQISIRDSVTRSLGLGNKEKGQLQWKWGNKKGDYRIDIKW